MRSGRETIRINKLSLFKLSQSFKMQSPLFILLEKDRWRLTPTWFADDRNRLFTIEEKDNKQLLLRGHINLGVFFCFFSFYGGYFSRYAGAGCNQ